MIQTDKKHYIYLCGNISSDIKTYEWRDEFENLVIERDIHIKILNPCRNHFNDMMRPNRNMKKGEFFQQARLRSFGVLPLKDYQLIKICTLLVANLTIFNIEKPMIGSLFELAWARGLNIPVIAIVDESTSLGELYSRHPFIDICISERVKSVKESVDIIEEFFIITD